MAPTQAAVTGTSKPGCRAPKSKSENPSLAALTRRSAGGFGLLFVVLGDVLVDAVRERQVAVQIAGVRIVRVRDKLELLLTLPVQDALAAWRVVVAAGDLLDE